MFGQYGRLLIRGAACQWQVAQRYGRLTLVLLGWFIEAARPGK
jgi:hypothetical protein